MDRKMVPVQTTSEDWAKFSINIAQKAEELLKSGKPKNLNHSNVVSGLLRNFLDNKYNININLLNEKGEGNKKMKCVVIEMGLWREARNYITQQEAQNNKISGGLGGLISGLVRAYNSDKVKL